jgi:hypothetical protein
MEQTMNAQYLPDRFPVTPLALSVGDRILIIHTEGQPDEVVDWWIVGRDEKRAEGGKTAVTVTYRDASAEYAEDDELPTREFADPAQWVSVAFPVRRHARAAA